MNQHPTTLAMLRAARELVTAFDAWRQAGMPIQERVCGRVWYHADTQEERVCRLPEGHVATDDCPGRGRGCDCPNPPPYPQAPGLWVVSTTCPHHNDEPEAVVGPPPEVCPCGELVDCGAAQRKAACWGCGRWWWA